MLLLQLVLELIEILEKYTTSLEIHGESHGEKRDMLELLLLMETESVESKRTQFMQRLDYGNLPHEQSANS